MAYFENINLNINYSENFDNFTVYKEILRESNFYYIFFIFCFISI